MGFINSYKHLEKLCGEMLGTDIGGVTAYIDEMKKIQNGEDYVCGWQSDLKKLIHYRHIRNLIAHEPEYTEANSCTHGDEIWINDFYNRVMNRTDPLAMYRKASKRQRKKNAPSVSAKRKHSAARKHKKTYRTKFLIAALMILAVLILYKIIR